MENKQEIIIEIENTVAQEEIIHQEVAIDRYWRFEKLGKIRETQFDESINKIMYYQELEKTEHMFKQFAENLREQIKILAFGGNRRLLDIINKDDSDQYMFGKVYDKDENWVLTYLWDKYMIVNATCSGLFSNIKRNEVYVDIEKEKILNKIFQD